MRRSALALGFALAGGCINHDGNLGADNHDGGSARGGSSGTGSSGIGGESGSTPDAGGGSAGGAGRGGSAGTEGSAGSGATAGSAGNSACSAEGTWALSYEGECFNGSDVVFVARTGSGPNDYRVRFANRPPLPVGCAATDEPAYSTSIAFDPVACTLDIAYDASLCASGALRCQSTQPDLVKVDVHLTLLDPTFGSWAGTNRCPAPPQTQLSGSACAAKFTRLAGPGECPASVVGNTACATSAVCDSGCGTPCRCENRRWRCEVPPVGQACWGDESCTYGPDADGGGRLMIMCTTPSGGQPLLRTVATFGQPTVCPAEPPGRLSPCNSYPRALLCGYSDPNPGFTCVCVAGDASIDYWQCTP